MLLSYKNRVHSTYVLLYADHMSLRCSPDLRLKYSFFVLQSYQSYMLLLQNTMLNIQERF